MEDLNKQLLQAADDNLFPGVLLAVESGADLEAEDFMGDTALNIVCAKGNMDAVKFLLDKGANIQHAGGADKTPIKSAAFAGHFDVANTLLERGATIDNDLISTLHMKIGILEENAGNGLVNPQELEDTKKFLELLVQKSQ